MISLHPQKRWQGDFPPSYTIDQHNSKHDLKYILQAWVYMKIKSHDHSKVLILGDIADEIIQNTMIDSVHDHAKHYPIVHLKIGVENSGKIVKLCPLEVLPPILLQDSHCISCNNSTGIISISINSIDKLYQDEALRYFAANISIIIINETATAVSHFETFKFTHFLESILNFRSPLAPGITVMAFINESRLETSEIYKWSHIIQDKRPITEVILNTNLASKLHPNNTIITHNEEIIYSLDILPSPRIVIITPVSRYRNLDLVRASIQFSHIHTWVIVYTFNSSNGIHTSAPPMLQTKYQPTKIIELKYDVAKQQRNVSTTAGNGERNVGLRYLYHKLFLQHSHERMQEISSVSSSEVDHHQRVHDVCHELATKNLHDYHHCLSTIPFDKWTVFLDDDNVIHRNFWLMYMTKELPQILFTGKVFHTALNHTVFPLKCKVYWLDSGQMISSLYLLHKSREFWHLPAHHADGLFFESVCKHYPYHVRKVEIAGSYHNALLVPHTSLEEDL